MVKSAPQGEVSSVRFAHNQSPVLLILDHQGSWLARPTDGRSIAWALATSDRGPRVGDDRWVLAHHHVLPSEGQVREVEMHDPQGVSSDRPLGTITRVPSK